MKKRIFRYIAFFAALMVIAVSCEKTDIQKANDEYDFGKIVPVVQGITGSANGTQTFTGNYSVNYFRGGSTWNWSVVGGTITATTPDTRGVTVQYTTAGTVTLTVTETTLGGITSDPFSKDITVAPFCPLTRDGFLGTWTGTEAGSAPGAITVTFVAGTAADEIKVLATAGIPAFLGGVFTGWGEEFQASIAPAGNITLKVNANGSVSIPWTYWGQTLPGPYDYWYWGSGLWSNCGAKPTLTFDINLDYNGNPATPSSNRKNTVTLTKN